jgi:hypothetical protein
MKKLSLKKITMLAALITLVSCGGSENKVNSTTGTTLNGSTLGTSSQQITTSQLPGDIRSVVSELAGSLQCPYGKRLTNVLQFNAPLQSNDHTKVCGQFQQGTMPGTNGQKYIGVSPYNDFMVVVESVSNGRVVGHNVFLSMCASYLNYYGMQLPLIDDARPIGGFQAPNCIVLDKDNFCPNGVVDAAMNTYMVAGQYQYNVNGMTGTLNPYEIWTTFFKPTCNGQF